MPTPAENYWDADTLTYTTDPREIKRNLETGRVDPRAVLAYLETLEEAVDENSDAVDRLNESESEVAEITSELSQLERTLSLLRNALDQADGGTTVEAFRTSIAKLFPKPTNKKGRN